MTRILGNANDDNEGICLQNQFLFTSRVSAPPSFFPSKYLVCEIPKLTMTRFPPIHIPSNF